MNKVSNFIAATFLVVLFFLPLNAFAQNVPQLAEALSPRDSVVFGISNDGDPSDLIMPFAPFVEGGVPAGTKEDQQYFEVNPFWGHPFPNASVVEFRLCAEIAARADANAFGMTDSGGGFLPIFTRSASPGDAAVVVQNNLNLWLPTIKRGDRFLAYSKDSLNRRAGPVMLAQKVVTAGDVLLPRVGIENDPPQEMVCKVNKGDVVLHIEDSNPATPECLKGSDCDYNDMLVVMRQVQKVKIEPLCVFDSENEMRWAIHNNNPFDIDVEWTLNGVTQQFTPVTIPANGKVEILTGAGPGFFAVNYKGELMAAIQYPDIDECAINVRPTCSDYPALERRWTAINPHYGSADFNWELFGACTAEELAQQQPAEQGGPLAVDFDAPINFESLTLAAPQCNTMVATTVQSGGQVIVKAGFGQACSTRTGGSTCNEENGTTFWFKVRTGTLLKPHDYVISLYNGDNTLVGVAQQGTIPVLSFADDAYLLQVEAPSVLFPNEELVNAYYVLEIPTLGIVLESEGAPIDSQTAIVGQIYDECGVCRGDGTSCVEVDCAGQPGGDAVEDENGVCCPASAVDLCGICGGENACLDCEGVPNGNNQLDELGACCLETDLDECGICGGNNDCITVDCLGQPGGNNVIDSEGGCCAKESIDQCDICFGDGTSCLGCESLDITAAQFTLDGNGDAMNSLAKKAANLAKKQGAKAKFAKNTKMKANELYQTLWFVTWSIPSIITTCENTELCFELSVESNQISYQENSEALYALIKKAVKKARKLSGKPKLGVKILKAAKKLQDSNQNLLGTIPGTTTTCF